MLETSGAPSLCFLQRRHATRGRLVCVEGAHRVAACSDCRRAGAGADALPGSEFQLLVVYQQGMAAHELEQVIGALGDMTAEPVTYYPARFSEDKQFGLVGDSCEHEGCHAEVHSTAFVGSCWRFGIAARCSAMFATL